jgi:regulator of cell morphogenesis and NO signaling
MTVGQLVASRPSRSRVFQNLGIDFCCGGKITLEEAARRKSLDPQTVLAMLVAGESDPGPSGPDPALLGLAELCDHIEQKHHAYLKSELPRLEAMLVRVARAHGERFPWMVQVLETFGPFSAEMFQHMAKEERVLFPLIRSLEAGHAGASGHCGGTVANPIRLMEHDHDDAGAALARMRELTNGYTPPPQACNTFRAALDALAELERDTHEHVHKENNILFPAAMKREASLQPQPVS